ncbi:hypothetical protein GCK72_012599 [Caenorhabditis remanei]|uniref:ELM2 domain-containing protein n=1 Tax=Caenorhabditis remanei TaxID=31234 RepID=A0A6A5GNM3_CAERE|nr:hypothetical protein GCK72_012599 [Caenorhabditis remanei]KAF1756146.1 hypothetical protein GCK72_012599 [Caenorhabditis remanei]
MPQQINSNKRRSEASALSGSGSRRRQLGPSQPQQASSDSTDQENIITISSGDESIICITPPRKKQKRRRNERRLMKDRENLSSDDEENGIGGPVAPVLNSHDIILYGHGDTESFACSPSCRVHFQKYQRMADGDELEIGMVVEEVLAEDPDIEEEEEDKNVDVGKKTVLIGPNYPPDLPEMLTTTPFEDNDRDELTWTPPASHQLKDINNTPQQIDKFYELTRNVYWRAIWRGFDGHIPYEIALENLMKNNYDIFDSLDSIDQYLHVLPRQMKPPCAIQMKFMYENSMKDVKALRQLQKRGMQNYNLAEIHQYRHKMIRFFHLQPHFKLPCNCDEVLCSILHFLPRYACENCTRRIRNIAEPNENRLCLICKTWRHLNGNIVDRPARNVVFTDEETENVEKCNRLEHQMGRHLKSSEFDDHLKKERDERWSRLELTDEEKKSIGKGWSKMSGKDIVDSLQPFVMPLFVLCRCQKQSNGGDLELTAEQKEECLKLIKKPVFKKQLSGKMTDQAKVAEKMGVAVEKVERFVESHNETSDVKILVFYKNYIPNLPTTIRRFAHKIPGDIEPWRVREEYEIVEEPKVVCQAPTTPKDTSRKKSVAEIQKTVVTTKNVATAGRRRRGRK